MFANIMLHMNEAKLVRPFFVVGTLRAIVEIHNGFVLHHQLPDGQIFTQLIRRNPCLHLCAISTEFSAVN